ncbi:MAG: hypothetical protein N2C12_16980, partial [Planctomycetales bacterium]
RRRGPNQNGPNQNSAGQGRRNSDMPPGEFGSRKRKGPNPGQGQGNFMDDMDDGEFQGPPRGRRRRANADNPQEF